MNIDTQVSYKEAYIDKLTALKENGGLQLFLPGYFYEEIVKKRQLLGHPKSVWKGMKKDKTVNVQPLTDNFSNLVML